MNQQEVGRTPFERDFTWYGTYDVQIRHEGYRTLKTRTPLIAPWWQWPPFDLVAELLPLRLRDERRLHYRLEPLTEEAVGADQMLTRAAELRGELEWSRYSPPPTPATAPAR